MDLHAQLEVIGEVLLAMLLGGAIGYERELAHKPAGLRTHMLVAAAAALLVGLAEPLVSRFSMIIDREVLQADPIRIVEAIITGISFLCAGTIFRLKQEEQVQGLTTAASILLVAVLGICVAVRQFLIAVAITLITVLVLWVVHLWEEKIRRR